MKLDRALAPELAEAPAVQAEPAARHEVALKTTIDQPAAISPVVYICAMPGDSNRFCLANSAPYRASASIIQSCSPLVSV